MSAWTLDDLGDLGGRTVLVTGGTAGIGLAVVHTLARHGARVIAAGRRRDAGLPDGATWLPLDLADDASVASAASAAGKSLDVLVNNAGINLGGGRVDPRGREMHMAVNHIGHVALTAALLPALARGRQARVVCVSSEAHRRADPDISDLDALSPRAYENSKLAMLLFAFELDRRLRAADVPVRSVACHPGFVDTEMIDGIAGRMSGEEADRLRAAAREHALRPEQGAITPCWCAFAPDVEGGAYVEPVAVAGAIAVQHMEPGAQALDRARAQWVWDASLRMAGVRFDLAGSHR